jgi:hypothetical protein
MILPKFNCNVAQRSQIWSRNCESKDNYNHRKTIENYEHIVGSKSLSVGVKKFKKWNSIFDIKNTSSHCEQNLLKEVVMDINGLIKPSKMAFLLEYPFGCLYIYFQGD